MRPIRLALSFGLSSLLLAPADLCHASTGDDPERFAVRVRETAGIRRFGYPVGTELKIDPPVPSTAHFRLLHFGKPVPAQFRPLERQGDRISSVALDFDSSFMPHESREYLVEFGENVVPVQEPDRGMHVDEADDGLLVSNGPNLVWTVPKNLSNLIRSVKTPKWDYLRPDSAGLAARFNDGHVSRLGDADKWRMDATVVKQGPIDCVLRFHAVSTSKEDGGVSCKMDFEFPRSKSWVRALWTIDDPKGVVAELVADLNLQVGDGPTLVDFAAAGIVYAAVPEGQVAVLEAGSRNAAEFTEHRGPRPFWSTFRGPPGNLEPYVIGPSHDPTSVEGWAHVMDRQRCTAIAFANFASRALDRVEVASDGKVQISRHIATENGVPSPGPKSLAFWLHFVPFPPHVGAVTSPQSMQSPLEIEYTRTGRQSFSSP